MKGALRGQVCLAAKQVDLVPVHMFMGSKTDLGRADRGDVRHAIVGGDRDLAIVDSPIAIQGEPPRTGTGTDPDHRASQDHLALN